MKNLFALIVLFSLAMLMVGCGSGYEPVHTLPVGFQDFESYISTGCKPLEMGFVGQPSADKKFLIYRFPSANSLGHCALLTNAYISKFAKRAYLLEEKTGIYMIYCTLDEYNHEVRNQTWRISPPNK